MKKFVLILLFVFLFAGLIVLAYGFYNAKNIRDFSKKGMDIMKKRNIVSQIDEVKNNYQNIDNRDVSALYEESINFQNKINGISQETDSIQQEVFRLGTSKTTASIKQQMLSYFTEGKSQLRDINGIVSFMHSLFGLAKVFDKIDDSTPLDQIQQIISEANVKTKELDPSQLPEPLRDKGTLLKETFDKFMLTMEKAAQKSPEGLEQLDADYAEFSKAQQIFFQEAKNYINSLKNLDPQAEKIDSELSGISKIFFSLR
jgi:hypothetical protein